MRLTMRNQTTNNAYLIDVDEDDVQDAVQKLADYEDAEEQGYCYRFPCKVGDVVYFHWHCSDETTIVYPAEVKEIRIGTYMLRKGIMFRIEPRGYVGMIRIFYHSDWGYCLFKSKEEAEKALEDMKGKV